MSQQSGSDERQPERTVLAEGENPEQGAPRAPGWAMGLVSLAVSFGTLALLTGLAALARPDASNER